MIPLVKPPHTADTQCIATVRVEGNKKLWALGPAGTSGQTSLSRSHLQGLTQGTLICPLKNTATSMVSWDVRNLGIDSYSKPGRV